MTEGDAETALMLVSAVLAAGSAFLACTRSDRGVELVGLVHQWQAARALTKGQEFDLMMLLLTSDRLTWDEVRDVLPRS